MLSKSFPFLFLVMLQSTLFAQDSSRKWYARKNFSGSLESNMQYYQDDKKTGTSAPYRKFAANNYFNLNYSYSFLEAGIQVENYAPRLQGYSVQYDSITKLVHRFVRLKHKLAELTVGHFYDQFGTGMLFRAYEERQLGIDNVIDGGHLKLMPFKNARIKGFYGRQRNFMTYSPASVWGADAEWDITGLGHQKNGLLTLGAGLLQKVQDADIPLPNFPEQVTAAGIRVKYTGAKYALNTEYIHKTIEPDFLNGFIYKVGSGFLLNQSYSSDKGWGANLSLRRLENMDFKSNYNSGEAVSSLNYLPALTKQHTYLVSTIYPVNTQWLSEMGGQLDYFIFFRKKSKIGGKYGAKLSLNASFYNSLDTVRLAGNQGFTSKVLALGKTKLYRDFNATFEKRWSKLFKGSFTYIHLYYNKSILQGGLFDNVSANITVADLLFNINDENSIRAELQHMATRQDEKNWAAFMVEYTTSKGLAFFIADLKDYQFTKTDYYNCGATYTKGGFRILAGVSRQRAGLICVGGLCRFTPSYTGFNLNLNYNF